MCSEAHRYGEQPSLRELLFLLATAVGHVVVELICRGPHWDGTDTFGPHHVYNIVVAFLWAGYVVWRAVKTPGALRAWGLTREGAGGAFKACAVFALVAVPVLLVYGRYMDRAVVPITVWFLVLLYPVWGLAQQFALQALITRNMRGLVPRRGLRVVVAAALFSAVHFPNLGLMALTLGAGCVLTWIYERYGNLWPLGVVHGLLGALAYWWVLGLDMGERVVGMVHG